MSRTIVALYLTVGLLVTGGCAVPVDGPGRGGHRPVAFIGKVVYVPVEGGFHGVVTRDGRKLDPMNLHESLRREGLVIEGVYRVREGMASIRQWGTIVELVRQQRAW